MSSERDRTLAPGLLAQLRTYDYQGFPTFARRPLLTEPEQLDQWKPDVAVVGAPWDDSTTYRPGARFGPRALRTQAAAGPNAFQLDARLSIFDHLEVIDFGDALCDHGMVEASHAAIRDRVYEIASRRIVPIVIGGDHSITWPSASAVAEARGFGSVGVVHFDAHADTASTIGGNLASHGTPMRRLIESGAVLGKNFVQVGLRGYWPRQDVLEWMEQQGMVWHSMDEIWERGCRAVIEDAINEALKGPDAIYLSVDIDVLDPGFAPGTGTPEPGGLTPLELLQSVRQVARRTPIVGMDIVEVSPPYDCADVTVVNAHRVVLEVLTALAQKNRDLTSGATP
jgi:guanidinobutyrase